MGIGMWNRKREHLMRISKGFPLCCQEGFFPLSPNNCPSLDSIVSWYLSFGELPDICEGCEVRKNKRIKTDQIREYCKHGTKEERVELRQQKMIAQIEKLKKEIGV